MLRSPIAVALLIVCSAASNALSQATREGDTAAVRSAYKQLIDAENAHDLDAVAKLVADSQDTLFVAKAPVGWKGYWGKKDVMQHFHDLYQHPFRIDPDYASERIAFPAPGVGETYVPVNITAVYGNYPKPAPFIMVLLWITQNGSWKMVSDLPIPIPPQANQPSPDK
jgi:ketosteroid isomerase-like protein